MFKKALPIYSKKHLHEMNISIMVPIDIQDKDFTIKIAGKNEYQIFNNGELIGYGPAKAGHGFSRIDEYQCSSNHFNNRILIIVAGYNCNTFDRTNETPFICFEIENNKGILAYSNLETEGYIYLPRYQKVTRFSYQRPFSESYKNSLSMDYFEFGRAISFDSVEMVEVTDNAFLTRNVNYPKLEIVSFNLVQKELFKIDKNIKPYLDRYMLNEKLGIFPKETWEIDSNEIASQLVFTKENSVCNKIKEGESLTFAYDISVTGFISSKLNVAEDSIVYFIFDEINTSKDENVIDFKFYRNTTHNVVTYELKKGSYNLVTFLPYTAHYIKVVCIKGSVDSLDCGMILLENPNSYNFSFKFEDAKIEAIMKSARNTFASNAVDILTDCPSRERAGWLCDSYYSSQSELLFTGFNKVEHNFLENYYLYHQIPGVPEKMLPMCYPADFGEPNYIPNWSLFYILQLDSYLKRTGDNELIQKSKKNVLDLIDFFKKFENKDGLLEDLEGWVFVEWSHENDADHINGVNIPSNMLYARCLEIIDDLYTMPELKQQAKNIRNWINNNAFNGTYYIDNMLRDDNGALQMTDHIGETTQYYAFYFGLASKEDKPDLFNLMMTEFYPTRDDQVIHKECYKSNMIIGNYLRLQILNRYGMYDQTLKESVDYFYYMAKLTGTLWEHDSMYASLNHGFASYAANIIVEAVSGIKFDYCNKIIFKATSNYDKDFELNIPLNDKYLHVLQKNKELQIEVPDGYKLKNI